MTDFIFDHPNTELSSVYNTATYKFIRVASGTPDQVSAVYLTSPAIEPIATEGGVQAGTTPPVDHSTTNAYHMVAMLYIGED